MMRISLGILAAVVLIIGIGLAQRQADPEAMFERLDQDGELTQEEFMAVHYYACNDEEGWCIPVSQEYRVSLESDRNGGWNVRRGRPNQRSFRLRE